MVTTIGSDEGRGSRPAPASLSTAKGGLEHLAHPREGARHGVVDRHTPVEELELHAAPHPGSLSRSSRRHYRHPVTDGSRLLRARRALRRVQRPSRAGACTRLDRGTLDEIVATLLGFRLGQLVLATLSGADGGDPGEGHPVACGLHRAFEQRGVLPFTEPAVLLRAYAEIRDLLARNDVPVLLLKGWCSRTSCTAVSGIARIRRRSAGAQGRCAPRRTARRRPRLRAPPARQPRSYSATRHRAGRSAPGACGRRRRTPSTRRPRGTTLEISPSGRCSVRTASDETTLALVVTSLVEDVAFGMAKMKSACDVVVARAASRRHDRLGVVVRATRPRAARRHRVERRGARAHGARRRRRRAELHACGRGASVTTACTRPLARPRPRGRPEGFGSEHGLDG